VAAIRAEKSIGTNSAGSFSGAFRAAVVGDSRQPGEIQTEFCTLKTGISRASRGHLAGISRALSSGSSL
jgi:hypothetical protein